MAYQSLPNTFVSGGTIYSTAVSGNMVALLQGYTTGVYDGWFSDVVASGGVDVGSGAASMGSGGTCVFGNTTVNTFVGNNSGTFTSGLTVGLTATVGGDVNVTGNVTAAAGEVTGAFTVGGDIIASGDVYTTQWTDMSAASATVTGYDNGTTCINSYRYKRLGTQMFVSLNLGGASTAATTSFNLPVTAGASQIDMNFMGTGQDNSTTLIPPVVVVYTTGDTLRVDAYSDAAAESWTASNNKAVLAQFSYEVD